MSPALQLDPSRKPGGSERLSARPSEVRTSSGSGRLLRSEKSNRDRESRDVFVVQAADCRGPAFNEFRRLAAVAIAEER
jgi:hypothetical protein